MVKRKRNAVSNGDAEVEVSKKAKSKPEAESEPAQSKQKATASAKQSSTPDYEETIQVILGSYDRVLHGLSATVRVSKSKGAQKSKASAFKTQVDFADTFLFTAHSSAIRCVAVSPPSKPIPGQAQKVYLASGASDERINVYDLSAHPPRRQEQDALSAVTPRPVLENRNNRELGTLMHHGSSITALRFPTRGKMLSSSDDSTVAVTRTRDWSVLSTIKAPIAKALGRPSGDTAAFGATPSGVSDFAIHPSMKLMITVSKGERSMRLWNLMTGKKAGVLNFDRSLLSEIGEGRRPPAGEGRRVIWGAVDGDDGEFAVVFDRDVVVFGMDSLPKCRVMPGKGAARTKIHHAAYIPLDEEGTECLLAVSTEDGRIVFTSTKSEHITPPAPEDDEDNSISKAALGTARVVGQIGGKEEGVTGRIKEFTVIRSEADVNLLYVITGSSDGRVRLWTVELTTLTGAIEIDGSSAEKGNQEEGEKKKTKKRTKEGAAAPEAGASEKSKSLQSVGTLAGTYETQNRITCLAGYLMIPRGEGVEDSEDESLDDEEEDDGSSSGEDSN